MSAIMWQPTVVGNGRQLVRNGWRETGTTGCAAIDRLIYGGDELQASLNLRLLF